MNNDVQTPRIVLVHGALHGAWCWEKIAPILTQAGLSVEAFDLPACGDDQTPAQNVTFADYVKRTVEVIRSRKERVVLVGHSMAGGIVSRAAEEAVDQVGKLVYLTAMLPKDGEALGSITEFGEDSVMRGVRPSDIPGTSTFARECAADIFYNTCAPDVAHSAVSRLASFSPIEPLFAPIQLTDERFGAIAKTYIVCARDHAMPLRTQHWMCARYPGIATHTLDTDHSPFFSDPQGLARILLAEAGVT